MEVIIDYRLVGFVETAAAHVIVGLRGCEQPDIKDSYAHATAFTHEKGFVDFNLLPLRCVRVIFQSESVG